MTLKPILISAFCLVFSAAVFAESKPAVDESAITATTAQGVLRVSMPIESKKGGTMRLTMAIVDEKNNVVASTDGSQKVTAGITVIKREFAIKKNVDVGDLIWNRLRYSVAVNGEESSGSVSLSQILPELFGLTLMNLDDVRAGAKVPIRIRAKNPVTDRPIAGVRTEAELEIDVLDENNDDDDDELTIKGESVTDDEGYATIDFLIPANVKFEDELSVDLTVTGEKNGVTDLANDGIYSRPGMARAYITLDKPIYQPGQMLRARALVLIKNRELGSNVPVAGREIEISIEDEDSTVVFKQKATTTEFGIAAIEWAIPPNAKLGTFSIRVESDADDLRFFDRQPFRVTRYDLPNFIVLTKADRDFYLPDQREAEVTVDANYLFGKPVATGTVKVVRESDRRWNFRDQKWDVEEEAAYTGNTDADGKYRAKIDLGKALDELKDAESEKFRDLGFTAYFTDPTTNRTEERRFDLRITKEPIHVYLRSENQNDEHPNLPAVVFVSTMSADGKPISCDVEVNGRYEDENSEKLLTKSKTDSNGNAKMVFAIPRPADGEYDSDLELKFQARDGDRTGIAERDLEIDDSEKQIRVSTDKSLYKPGEPVRIAIESSEPSATVFLDVVRDSSAVVTKRLRTINGRALLIVPYRPQFRGFIRVTAYTEDDGEAVSDVRRIVFPDPRKLTVDAKTEKAEYRPNDQARLDLGVRGPDNAPVESAIGLVIVDRAVEERARTDSNFRVTPDAFRGLRELVSNLSEVAAGKVTPEIELEAEMTLSGYPSDIEATESYIGTPASKFEAFFRSQFEPFGNALRDRFTRTSRYPTDDASLKRILAWSGIDFSNLRDPWGMPYAAAFATFRSEDMVVIKSSGPNKKAGDDDDFSVRTENFAYFTQFGQRIDAAIAAYHERTGNLITDETTFRSVLAENGIDFDAIRDKWNRPYRLTFGAQYVNSTIEITSGGATDAASDDFSVWVVQTRYFAADEKRINELLSKNLAVNSKYPANEAEFKQVLATSGIDFDALRDGWGRPYYIEFRSEERFTDKMVIETTSATGALPTEIIKITPVTQTIAWFDIRSLGEDNVKNYNDVYVSRFSGIVAEKTIDSAKPRLVIPRALLVNGNSAIYGVVSDLAKSGIANVEVTAINAADQKEHSTSSAADGSYLLTGIPPGLYSIRFRVTGFKTTVINYARLRGEQLLEANSSLGVGSVDEIVTVSSITIDATGTTVPRSISGGVIETLPIGTRFSSFLRIAPNVRPEALAGGFQINGSSGSESVFVLDGQEITNFRTGAVNGVFELVNEVEKPRVPENNDRESINVSQKTPRLRDYFPETLLFIPQIVTSKDGKAAITYQLADNITTWKIYAVASDKQGRVGFAESDVKAFQPFFADLDPPKFLTVGDEIQLPVQVRNYTPESQKVEVRMDRSDWFTFLEPNSDPQGWKTTFDGRRQLVEVATNSSSNAIFGFRSDRAVSDGRQRVTALSSSESDAIEKVVTVRPDGEEINRNETRVFGGSTEFQIDFPSNALPGSASAELIIYPNLLSNIEESIEGLLRRPYGCAEQTISSTYPNLMIAKVLEASPAGDRKLLRARAMRNLQRGYDRLIGYQSSDGGFSYWGGKSETDISLTAYAIRFMTDAKGSIAVDESIIERARRMLLGAQREDGSWGTRYGWETADDIPRTRKITAYVARVLAMQARDRDPKTKIGPETEESLKNALAYLKSTNGLIDEPYVLANYGLAALDSGDTATVRLIAAKLYSLAIAEGPDKMYWNLETNTPFYGWGTPGRIETTAIVVQFLARARSTGATQSDSALANSSSVPEAKGLLFLLSNKDRYGVWFSTQATVNVLDALLASLTTSAAQRVIVTAGNRQLKTIQIKADEIAPVTVDLDESIAAGTKVSLTSDSGTTLMARVARTHYIAWKDSLSANSNATTSRLIQLDYACDKTAGKIMETVTCSVSAERVGFKGYGMLLAEIGIPPGADVSRESLEKAMKDNGGIGKYEVQPDRIVFYLWAIPGGTKFSFSFKPRYGINAQTPPSVLYDYYNEEAKAVVAPLKFRFE